MSPRAKKSITFVLRWGIAVLGIGWVISNISIHDRVLIANPRTGRPTPARLAAAAGENSQTFVVYTPFTKSAAPDGSALPATLTVNRDDLFVKSDRDQVTISEPDGSTNNVEILGLKVTDDTPRETWPLLVCRPRTFLMKYTGRDWGDLPRVIDPSRIVPRDSYHIRVPYPIIDVGIGEMTRQAFADHPMYLILAIVVFPITFIITSYRWNLLMRLLEVYVPLGRTFVINMVGAFYNTFMPGSTGGDVLKAYYAAKQVPNHRTRAVMSVIVDRIIGLLALVILGGSAATYQYLTSSTRDPVTHKCGQVALGSAAIMGGTVLGLLVFYSPLLRRISGLDFILRRLPMQSQVQKAVHTMEIYGRHPWPVIWATAMTLPVHGTVVVSATFAGMAFGLPMHWAYYWVAVPVIVLSGAIPISPQGAGVMEFFAILLTRSQGVTISQAFALTMSLRAVQILWNLSGGFLVLRGGYHAPTSAEQHQLQVVPDDDDDTDASDGTRRPVPAPQPA
jgi:uncharacterized membrane protein YbhN (UPF0104 family)